MTAEAPAGVVVVLNEAGVVLGLLDSEAFENADSASAEEVMEPAPITYRPSLPLEKAMERLHESKKEYALVTTGDGILVGLLTRA